jgi:hypothetical protein
MAFLTINGWDVPIADGQASLVYQQLGRQSRSYSGVLSGTYRAKVREWKLQTTLEDEASAEAIEGLIDGTGHVWTFDNDLYSSKGLGPATGYSVTVAAAGGKIGGMATVASNTAISWAATSVNVPWTLLAWKKDLAGAWQHYGLNVTGTQFKNGAEHTPAAGDSVANWAVHSSGNFSLLGKGIDGANAAAFYDELVIVPYLMPIDQIAATYTEAVAGRGFSALPVLKLTGDCVAETYSGPLSVIGEMGNNAFVQAMYSGSFQSNLRRMDFVLREVQDVDQL